ncbi:hypothetical protein [Spongiactinospora sp. TRM90649]|uniref:hypothetical protein n=1 Tax=Spongiactinospora sp. TRM90649 TaxID=3031114 RepID=UPI0023F916F8|nr:hypothetical protein [Spongiactinospora sp. TRM90649]MDF5759191.1 hypothetical protein [Spongiactinospora sp. TRM90649]
MSQGIAMPTTGLTCRTWCRDHDSDGDICHAAEIPTAGDSVGLTTSPASGPLVWVGDTGYTPAQAAHLIRVLQAQLALAGVTA